MRGTANSGMAATPQDLLPTAAFPWDLLLIAATPQTPQDLVPMQGRAATEQRVVVTGQCQLVPPCLWGHRGH